jgi:hypothetical protein
MMHAPLGPKMTQARKTELIDQICKQLRQATLQQPGMDIAGAVKQKQKWLARAIAADAKSPPINIKAINKAAKELRALLKNTFFSRFEDVDGHLQYFAKLNGPGKHDRPKFLAAEWTRTLIKKLSMERPTNNPKGPLRVISGLIYAYTTEQEKDGRGRAFNFERACKLVLKLAPPPRVSSEDSALALEIAEQKYRDSMRPQVKLQRY